MLPAWLLTPGSTAVPWRPESAAGPVTLTARTSQLPVSLQLGAQPACPGSHHCVCVCSWPLPYPDTCRWLPTAKCVFTTGSSHYCCLPWSLASELGLTSENPNSPCGHWRYSSCGITKDHAVERVPTCPTPVQHITGIPSQSNPLDKEKKEKASKLGRKK